MSCGALAAFKAASLLSILAMGLGLAKIKSQGLYADLKCRSMAEYIERLKVKMRIRENS